jgi:hypothetical protein
MPLTSAREPADTLSSPNNGSDAMTKFAATHTLPDRPKGAESDYTSFAGEIVSPQRRKTLRWWQKSAKAEFFRIAA